MFDSKLILWFVNTRLGRRIIAVNHEQIKGKIVKVTHNSYHVLKGKNIEARFYPTNAIAKRLFPFGNLLHSWDMLIANRFAPALNLGFDTFQTASGDGSISMVNEATWAGARDVATGEALDDTSTTARVQASRTGSGYSVSRVFLYQDTSSIADGATIDTASLTFYQSSNDSTRNLVLCIGTQTTPSMSTADFDAFTRTNCGTVQGNGGAVGTFASGANLKGNVSKVGLTKWCIQHQWDFDNTSPTLDAAADMDLNMSEAASNKPYLTVTYVVSSNFFAFL